MDNVYNVASGLKLEDFKHIQSDNRQIIIFTDGPVVTTIYFTRDNIKNPKILGISLCLEDEENKDKCVETDSIKQDEDGDGWWDIIEERFY